MGVKLSGSLHGGDRHGLDTLHGELVRHPENSHIVVGMIDCSSTKIDHGADGETFTPTARFLYLEPVRDEQDAEALGEMLGRMRAERVGDGTVALDLDPTHLRGVDDEDGEL